MTDAAMRVLERLRALFEAIAEEAHANPLFAKKVEASLASAAERARRDGAAAPRKLSTPVAPPKDISEAHTMLHNITFDPLECQIEAALLSGREQEARAFLGKLDRVQLGAVVTAQRLPGARGLQKAIQDATDPAFAVDAIVGSAAERVRSRYSASGMS
jgi:hypothetical protein